VVEDCLILDINMMLRQNLIQNQSEWKSTFRIGIGSEINIKREPGCDIYRYGFIKLNYAVDNDPIEYIIPIDLTHTRTGKRIWWFLCPIQRNGIDTCLSMVKKLYLPPGGKYFGCRQCYDLSYESRQNWDRRKRKSSGKIL